MAEILNGHLSSPSDMIFFIHRDILSTQMDIEIIIILTLFLPFSIYFFKSSFPFPMHETMSRKHFSVKYY